MPRSNRPRRGKGRGESDDNELNLSAVRFGIKSTVVKRGVVYTVQSTNGGMADDGKTWTCPECHLTISKGTPHTVAWDEIRGLDTRRHFHNHCWKLFQGPLL